MIAWYRPTSSRSLAACRIVYFGGLLVVMLRRDFAAWDDFVALAWVPTKLLGVLAIPAPIPGSLGPLAWAWRASLLLACAGVLTRVSCALAFGLGTYLLAVDNCFGSPHHNDAFVPFVLLVFAFSDAGATLSWDARRRGSASTPSAELDWPIQLVRALHVLVYLGAGVSKLRTSGLAWMSSENLARLLERHHHTHVPVLDIGPALARMPHVPGALGIASVALELAAPLALVDRRARTWLMPALFAMHVGIWLVMGVQFPTLMLAYCFWIDWDGCLAWFRRTRGAFAASP